ncbi:MAG TPA: tRNA uridine-5-carboxymethylaminomethyl(34) synthesis enzyme MnmG [Chloroflexota bacterium]|nr:tRNA uridine-5-carboxymethylaminomethyl(34) synthesis enzyme MnmG [Chloroflexota bacterium]
MTAAKRYDVIVVGAGHAGCEAALASARMGRQTLLLTLNLDSIALMPCNPSIGGPAKGHLVREIDALGGQMARTTDDTYIQIRMLNTGKGPAVQALRAQSDKRQYGLSMKRTLENELNLFVKQAEVVRLLADNRRIVGVETSTGTEYLAPCVVLTTGTFLNGKLIRGEHTEAGGRSGERPSLPLTDSLRSLGLALGRLKTGTPPRVDSRSIDYELTTIQPGDTDRPLYFSFLNAGRPVQFDQLPCHLVNTTAETHQIIRDNLHRAPMFNGSIKGIGPRYCPSIEDKIVRFADKSSHQLFLEPEGRDTLEVYVQGANTSLPEDVQLAMLRSIPALRECEMMRVGYAVEYDYVLTNQIDVSMETKSIRGLFLAGQINGTTGYEEAAGQGLVAGINAARRAWDEPAVDLPRSSSYIGVMVDDLCTKELTEPYRLFTSRAEYRLLLRQDNADLRLSALAHEVGLISDEQFERVEAKRAAVAESLTRLRSTFLTPTAAVNEALAAAGQAPLSKQMTAMDILRRPDISYDLVAGLADQPALPPDVLEQVDVEAKYEGYIAKQQAEVDRARKMETRPIPPDFDYDALSGLRTEARARLQQFRPTTLGQAARLYGVNPADVAILMVRLSKADAATAAA